MKRCNNCGWFNLDSSSECEKCGENSFELVVESVPESVPLQEEESLSEPQPDPSPLSQPEPELEPQPEPEACPVPVAVESVPQEEISRKAMAATIMDASAFFKDDEPEEVSCPKCRYPIAGEMEFCPNCGTTIKTVNKQDPPKEEPVPQQQESPKLSNKTILDNPKNLKATVRDIPEELLCDNAPAATVAILEKIGSLVPVDGADSDVIEIFENTDITIAGRVYRFQK